VNEPVHPRSAQVVDAVAQFNGDGSVEAAVAEFSPEVVFTAPGHSAVAGTYRGKEGVREFFEGLYRISGGTLTMLPLEVLSNDEHLVLFFRFTGQREDQTLDITLAGFHSDNSPDGWRRATFLPDDQSAFDRFFS
jgi:ketosteroid isomerase-like protein